MLLDPNGSTHDEQPGPFAFHPLPVPSRCCGVILQASYAELHRYCCPNCDTPVCYTCGCVESAACQVTRISDDGKNTARHTCGWAAPGICSFCYARAAYELYQRATGRAADDAYYMSLGHSVFAVKGLGWGHGIE